MIPILVLIALSIIVACASIGFKTTKTRAIIAIVCIVVIALLTFVCLLGFSNVTENSHVIANITLGDEHRDLFFDEVKDEYFYTKADRWRMFFPQYRVVVDYETAKAYVEQYEKLKEFDFATVVEGSH